MIFKSGCKPLMSILLFTNEMKLQPFCISKLRGSAEIWYRSLETRIYTWVELKRLLLETSPPRRDIHTMLVKMMNYKPSDTKDLYDCSFQKLILINSLKLSFSDEDKVNLIMGAVNDKQILFSVEIAGINKLANHLKLYSTPPSTSRQKYSIHESSADMANISSQKRRCYGCNQYGHERFSCPNARRPNINKRRGVDYHVNLIGGGDPNNKFYKQVKINRELHTAYVDLGSECSLITQDLATDLNLRLHKIQGVINLVNFIPGKFVSPLFVTQVLICLDNVAKIIEMYVVPDKIMNVDILVGQNFMELDDVQYIKKGNLLEFSCVKNPETKGGSIIDLAALNVRINDKRAIANLLEILNEFRDCIILNISELGEIDVLK